MIKKIGNEWTDDSMKDKVNEMIDQINALSEFEGQSYSFPCLGKKYRYISSKGKCESKLWDNSNVDNQRKNLGNCFENEEVAREAREAIREVYANL